MRMYIKSLINGEELKFTDINSYSDNFFILCYANEIQDINKVLKFDESTIEHCLNIDENVRFENFENYDFISFINFYYKKGTMNFSEINLYIAEKYLVLVLPQDENVYTGYKNYLDSVIMNTKDKYIHNRVYIKIFSKLLSDLFATLERLEDSILALEASIIKKNISGNDEDDFVKIIDKKNILNKIKKNLRPALYIGDQFLVNENEFIKQEKLRAFKNIDIRLNKLYDFVLNLNDMVSELMNLHESKITSHTNKIINKLTTITVIFLPLTLISGIYGMNFTNMPELHTENGYYITLGIMFLIGLSIFTILKKIKWL